jgi:hypothetical protein
MEDQKTNKGFKPASNKAELVKIKFRMGRAAEGVEMDAEGYAFVSAEKAAYLISINYADKAEEK